MTPADARRANDAALAVLLRAGAVAGAVHTLSHTLSGDPEALFFVRERFLRDGFLDGGYTNGVLTLLQRAPLHPEAIGAATDKMVGYAKASGLSYEGWRTAPIRRLGWLERLQRRFADAGRLTPSR